MVLGVCLLLLQKDALTVYRLSSDCGLYLNVKPDSIDGIDRARRLDLVSSGMADIYISQLLAYSITSLFTSAHKARMIAMFRHPTKRIIDLFYYQQRATWEPNYDVDMASMSLEEFAASDKLIDNFMIRLLLDLSVTTVITFQHVTIAKELVRTKFVVGITEWYDQVHVICPCGEKHVFVLWHPTSYVIRLHPLLAISVHCSV